MNQNSCDVLLLLSQKEIIPRKTLNAWEFFYKNVLLTNQFKNELNQICWHEEIKIALQKISSKFLILSPYDFICKEKMPEDLIDNLENLNAKYCRLVLRPGILRKTEYREFNRYKIFKLNARENYSINLQPSIWDKEFLLENLNRKEIKDLSIWEFDKYFYEYIPDQDKCNCYLADFNKNLFSSHYAKKGKQFRRFSHKSESLSRDGFLKIFEYNLKLESMKLKDRLIHYFFSFGSKEF